MSDKSIKVIVSERDILTAMDDMCAESLPPDTYCMWERVKSALSDTRKALSNEQEGKNHDRA